MDFVIRKAYTKDYPYMAEIWNEVVRSENAFPQTEMLPGDGTDFFGSQSHCAVAETEGKIVGLYILHPNNVGHCGHICNASYAVSGKYRGRNIGEALVKDSLIRAKGSGFEILQFNAVLCSNAAAIHIYEKLGFNKIGTVPGGYRHSDGTYEDIDLFYHIL